MILYPLCRKCGAVVLYSMHSTSMPVCSRRCEFCWTRLNGTEIKKTMAEVVKG